MPKIPCLGCGRLIDKAASRKGGRNKRAYARCPDCAPHAGITSAETRRRKQVVDAWVAVHGWVCPGWQRPPHPSHDLTADHVVAVVVNRNEQGSLTVLCRPCNSSKRDR